MLKVGGKEALFGAPGDAREGLQWGANGQEPSRLSPGWSCPLFVVAPREKTKGGAFLNARLVTTSKGVDPLLALAVARLRGFHSVANRQR